jgi:hypothetical protein
MPIEHVSAGSELTDAAADELKRFMGALARCFATKTLSVVFYERYIPTRAKQHMNVQVIPIPTHLAGQTEQAFRNEGRMNPLQIPSIGN